MNRKTISLVTIMLSVLFSISTTGVHAQFNRTLPGPNTTPPSISLSFPAPNQTLPLNNLTANFTVFKPDMWFLHEVAPAWGCQGEITEVYYNLDGEDSEHFPANDTPWGDYRNPLPNNINYSINLNGVSDGPHSLKIIAEGRYYYWLPDKITYNTVMGNSSEIRFSVDTHAPAILIVCPKNTTYPLSGLPLTFITGESASWMGYSLDDQVNATVLGNTSLTGLSDGSHHIIVYANDTVENMGKSETVFFTIDTATPSPTPSPTSTKTPTVTLPPTPTPSPSTPPTSSPSIPEFSYYTATILLILLIVAILASLIQKQDTRRNHNLNVLSTLRFHLKLHALTF